MRRGNELLFEAATQIRDLIGLLTAAGEEGLRRTCTGREQLGAGTVGAVASHAADRYLDVAEFVEATVHARRAHRAGAPHGGSHCHQAAGEVTLDDLVGRFSAADHALRVLGELGDEQLQAVPPAREMKFCDGRRTLEQIVSSLINHQRHQVDAIRGAIR